MIVADSNFCKKAVLDVLFLTAAATAIGIPQLFHHCCIYFNNDTLNALLRRENFAVFFVLISLSVKSYFESSFNVDYASYDNLTTVHAHVYLPLCSKDM